MTEVQIGRSSGQIRRSIGQIGLASGQVRRSIGQIGLASGRIQRSIGRNAALFSHRCTKRAVPSEKA
ncbi:hypothetical protein [Sporolactobacillus putidus]|uniref:hypothetical protein n=1 Tax=Sporolactobacillus putidus TaxID=492735 RepID=UPI0016642DA8|nr:hypothetical protein [Sporolactobacillus putidus]